MNDLEQRDVIVKATGLTKRYLGYGITTPALSDVDFCAGAGELVLLLGPSGSGKTTLLTVLAGLIEPSEGTVELFGRSVSEYSKTELQHLRATQIGFVFQNFMLLDALTVYENVAIVRSFANAKPGSNEALVLELLASLGLASHARRFPPELSQGEKQRVALARAVVNGAALIFADEPTANLESAQGWQIITLLKSFARERRACVVVASHDHRFTDLADRTVPLRDGRLDQPAQRRRHARKASHA